MHDGPGLALELPLIVSKINILRANNKTVVWSAACSISDLFTLRPISALPCRINQISDSSRPNNCILLFPNVKIDWNSRGYIIFDI